MQSRPAGHLILCWVSRETAQHLTDSKRTSSGHREDGEKRLHLATLPKEHQVRLLRTSDGDDSPGCQISISRFRKEFLFCWTSHDHSAANYTSCSLLSIQFDITFSYQIDTSRKNNKKKRPQLLLPRVVARTALSATALVHAVLCVTPFTQQ